MDGRTTRWILAGAVAAFAGIAQAQDFDGMYGGVVARNNFNVPGNIDVAVGAFAGYNVDMGNGLLAGVEGEVEYDWNSIWGAGGDALGTANVRVGADVGGALLYGKIGAGYSTRGTWVWGGGGGVDVPVMGDAFVRGEVQYLDQVGVVAPARTTAKIGLGYQF